ncbi:MAG: pilus assembly protein TadG-related protein [Candidatus Planktophila sp.]|jgi:hypothetical protein|tara:strand:- start:4028 stop:4573 length:546 start_codon:yes stop_codon:yes gene_type:complete
MDIKVKIVGNDRGSISLVVILFFLIIVLTGVILTDISTVALAKRSLTQATESAAQRGVRNLNKDSYYSGEFDITTMLENIFGIGPDDPGVPIDCSRALSDAQGALSDWAQGKRSLRRSEIYAVEISDLQCDGFGIEIATKAIAKLPIAIPLLNIDRITIKSKVSTLNIRDSNFAPFGIRIS